MADSEEVVEAVSETVPVERPQEDVIDWRQITSYLVNSNPFYLLSAGMVLYGLSQTFHAEKDAYDPWLLAGVLLGYICLSTLAGFAIIRWGGVWDDGRTLLLIVVLLLQILPITLDRIVLWLNYDGGHAGSPVLYVGLGVALLLSEFLLIGLQLGVTWRFRLPYYSLMSLSYLYTLVPQQVLDNTGPVETRWVLCAFPAIAAVVCLTLLPLAWAGVSAFEKNRAPWPWPYYPWSVFVLIGLGVVVRSYMLAISFDAASSEAIAYGTYWLLPLAFAVLFVSFEAGRASRSEPVMHACAMLAMVVPVLAVEVNPYSNPVYFDFAESYIGLFNTPPVVALCGTSLLLTYFAWQGIGWASGGLVASLLLLTYTDRWDVNGMTWSEPRDWSVLLLAFTLLWLRPHATWRLIAGIMLLGFGIHLHGEKYYPLAINSDYFALTLLHIELGILLIVGIVRQDWLAIGLRWLMIGAITMASLVAIFVDPMLPMAHIGFKGAYTPLVYPGFGLAYIGGWLMVLAAAWWFARQLALLVGGIGQVTLLAAWCTLASSHLVRGTSLEAGWLPITAGLTVFAIALAISVQKALRLGRVSDDVSPTPLLD